MAQLAALGNEMVTTGLAGQRRDLANSAICLLAGMTVFFSVAVAGAPSALAQFGDIFTVSNYPVEAEAANAVAAKNQAIADGQAAAFRSLLRRLVPVTRFAQIRSLERLDVGKLINGVTVADERNSRTRYEANLNFAFNETAVRQMLTQNGIAFVDSPAAETTVVAVYRPPQMVGGATVPSAYQGRNGARVWRTVWGGLDLKNAIAPARLARPARGLTAQVADAVIANRADGIAALAKAYGAPRVVLALLQPDLSAKRITFWLAGQDAVGPFAIKRSLRFEPADFDYTVELAAVISHGILEGRWKAVTPPANAAAAAASAPGGGATWQPLPGGNGGVFDIRVQFATLRDWTRIRRVLETLPGATNVALNGLSTREAQVAVTFPAGAQRLTSTLAQNGLTLEQVGAQWVLR